MKAFDYSTVLHVWFLCLAPSLAVRLDQLVMFLCILSYTRNKCTEIPSKAMGKNQAAFSATTIFVVGISCIVSTVLYLAVLVSV